ncbi:calcium/sodium antiporter [Candidatus Saccharibacteria bacterium]|nr:calcium/sodium antiporter [Candidatus Saccharibacteria bacterium]MCB9821096.1 calcium/sodium antiporter [Candidatus Nomurabacteria bacterium]
MIFEISMLVLGLLVVVKAADWFLAAAESIGVRLGLSPFVLGVLLVGFGTSLPELTTSLASVIDGVNHVAIANIVGSNLANILVILGISTFFMGTINFDKDLIDIDLPLLIGVTSLFGIMISDGNLSSFDGVLLLTGFFGYVLYTITYREKNEYHQGLVGLVASLIKGTDRQVVEIDVKPKQNLATSIFMLCASLILLGLASKLAVDNLLQIVEHVNYQVDKLTFFTLAIGTSLPELVVSLKALRRGQGDVVLGNILGSSIFNILMVGGVSSLVADQHISESLVWWSIGGLVLASMLLVVSGITRRIHAWEGSIYLLVYLALATKLI